MIEFVLIIAFYAGPVAKSDAVSIASVPGFSTHAECLAAGKETSSFATLMKKVNYVCVKRTIQ
ncbi:hypothetical protein SAMN05192560_2099 [Methylobacillus rhizosphaerae]|uniref:Uncharacterized protein n=1 Tax=Methylobacillus rhizosphaerae TaxID=551994 RepID=A0A239AT13_9PROT|nr:hypothetical protein [Methylobacillus rhizosphaerae]SNR98845.1 hypothetical protein SAMN05192560_2099 [Methylobacillus rhizosphaerae]